MMKLITDDDGLGCWERLDGSRPLATRLSQFYFALQSPLARNELKQLELWYSNTLVRQACERAWKIPGLGAVQTVDEIRRDLAERLYPMNAEPAGVAPADAVRQPRQLQPNRHGLPPNPLAVEERADG